MTKNNEGAKMTDQAQPREWTLSPTMTQRRIAVPRLPGHKGIHVIEHSAFEQERAKVVKLREALRLVQRQRRSTCGAEHTELHIRKVLEETEDV